MTGQMLSNFLTEGDKVEIQPLEQKIKGEKSKYYISSLQEVLSNDTVEILMPMEQNKPVLLSLGAKYELVFYNKTGLYQCVAKVIDRYRDNKLVLIRLEFETNLRKYQRREYYRYSCAFEMQVRNLDEEEEKSVTNNQRPEFKEDLLTIPAVIVDISGGGLRFMSSETFAVGSLIYCTFKLKISERIKELEVVGEILSSGRLDNRPELCEHRVQFRNIEARAREDIIKFIFEEERKSRKID